jgi:hypothetical protein
VRRQLRRVIGTEPTEVDDAADPGLGGGVGEVHGVGGIDPFEVVHTERMHEVVGDVDAGERFGQ